MNTQTPFWPLVRNELGFDHYPKLGLTLGTAYVVVCWWTLGWFSLMLLVGDGLSRGNIETLFTALGGVFSWMIFVWLAIAGILYGNALIPRRTGGVSNVRAFDYLCTRAIDRSQLYRAKVAVIAFGMLTPLLIDLLVCLVLRNGARAYMGWLVWSAVILLLLTQACYAAVGKRITDRVWVGYFIFGTFLLPGMAAVQHFHYFAVSCYKGSFLLFSAHPVFAAIAVLALALVVQKYSERRFAELEVP